MTAQPTTDEYDARVNDCVTLLIKGFSQQEIVTHIMTKTAWGKEVTDRTVRNYVYRARDELAKMATVGVDRREEFTKAILRLTDQYKRANQLSDVARAIAAQNSLIALMKLDQPAAAFSWESGATALGMGDDNLLKVQQAAEKMVQLAVRAPDSFGELCEVIDRLYERHQLTA